MAVYMIRASKSGAVKIGMTGDIRKRLQSLQTSHSEKLLIIRAFDGGRDLEKSLHEKFNNLRLTGEWFSYQEEMVSENFGATEINLDQYIDKKTANQFAAHSALFSCVQGKDRAMLDDVLIATIEGIEIWFTGEQFNQDDHNVLMQMVHMTAHQPLGEWVTVPAHALLKALGRKTGGKDHEQLRADLTRLMGGTVSLRNTRTKIEYIGHLLEKAVQDEESRYWIFQLNPDLRALYGGANYTLVDWERRKQLHGKDLARWLQTYIATHAALFPIKVATLRKLSGSRTKEIFSFRQTLRNALQDLTNNGDIAAWAIDPATDLVTVDRGNGVTGSQQRRLNKKKAKSDPPEDTGSNTFFLLGI